MKLCIWLSACRGNTPDENTLAIPGDEDLEYYRYKQLSTALYKNKMEVHLTTAVHPDGLLDGGSEIGPAGPEWPAPSL